MSRSGFGVGRTWWSGPTVPSIPTVTRRLALFDLDDTLVDHSDRFVQWSKDFAAARNLGDGAADWIVKASTSGMWRDELLVAVREHFFIEDPIEDLQADYVEGLRALIQPRLEVLAGLDRLRDAGWAVGIVTNGTQDMQWATLSAADLPDHVDSWGISGEVGHAKPERALFEVVAQRCGMLLEAGGWMVGNSATSDIAGGKAAGLRTIWIRHGQEWPEDAAPPEHTVDDVIEAFDLIC
jgi:FMN phosphatase YigB (HAD superfamily)